MKLGLEYIVSRNFPQVMAIERAAYANPWTSDEFLGELRRRNVHGLAAVDDCGEARGFVVYESMPGSLMILNLAVAPRWQHRGVGCWLFDKVKQKLKQGRRDALICYVSESNLQAQLFFRARGMFCTQIERSGFYEEDLETPAYRFELNLSRPPRRRWVNRISQLKEVD